MKLVKWPSDPKYGQETYHWCPACLKLHVIPREGWICSGSEESPTYSPSFGQHTAAGYCHYNITNGQIVFHNDSYHGRDDTVPMQDIPQPTLDRLTDAVFDR